MPLIETRTAEEARLIIAKRLAAGRRQRRRRRPDGLFRPAVLRGVQRPLHAAHPRAGADAHARAARAMPARRSPRRRRGGFISTLAAALGFGVAAAADEPRGRARRSTSATLWQRFTAQSEAEIPSDDQGLLDVLTGALALAREEWGRAIDLTVSPLELSEELPAVDMMLRHDAGFNAEARIFLCNRPTQGGGFKRQLDRLLPAMMGKNCFMLRASDFPPNKKNQTAQAFRKFREGGGRSAAGADPRLGAHDDGARVPRPASARSGLCRVVPGGEAAVGASRRSCRCCGSTCSARRSEHPHRLRPRRPLPVAAQPPPGCGRAGGRGGRAAAVGAARRSGRRRRQHSRRRGAALQQEHHAQQGRPEAPRGRARRLGLGQDDAGSVHHRAAAAARARRRC